jgi:hypothetical protein
LYTLNDWPEKEEEKEVFFFFSITFNSFYNKTSLKEKWEEKEGACRAMINDTVKGCREGRK